MSDKQTELFEEYKMLSFRFRNLGAVIQNDVKYLTREDIKSFVASQKQIIEEMNALVANTMQFIRDNR